MKEIICINQFRTQIYANPDHKLKQGEGVFNKAQFPLHSSRHIYYWDPSWLP